jgi:hypothetical protein
MKKVEIIFYWVGVSKQQPHGNADAFERRAFGFKDSTKIEM